MAVVQIAGESVCNDGQGDDDESFSCWFNSSDSCKRDYDNVVCGSYCKSSNSTSTKVGRW